MNKVYAAIDLKSFYASVECVERGLDPLTTNLVVADANRTEKTICLAVSPSLKSYGLPGRARLFEVVSKVKQINAARLARAPFKAFLGKTHQNPELQHNPHLALDYIIAPPRMQLYLDYSTRIYQIYLQHVAPEDIFAYSIDEIFCDITSYLKTSGLTPEQFITNMIMQVFRETGIIATAGIGTNLFLAKIAMDVLAKHATPNTAGVRLATLDEISFREQLWDHQPLTDFWRIGPGYTKRLQQHFMYTLGDVARCSLDQPELLYKLFGINAELLIDHAWGWECVEIADIRKHQPHGKSLSKGQVLSCPYDFGKARIIVDEMTEVITLEMMQKEYFTDQLVLHISYDVSSMQMAPLHPDIPITQDRHGRNKPKSAHSTWRLDHHTDSLRAIRQGFLELYDQSVCPDFTIRKITLCVANLRPKAQILAAKALTQTNLFEQLQPKAHQESTNQNLQRALLEIRRKYGKNAILRGTNFEPGATGIARNHQIGGHRE